MRALVILALIGISVAVSHEVSHAAQGASCETVPSPVFGEVTHEGRRYAATAGGLLITDEATGESRVQTACDGLAGTYLQAVAKGPKGGLTLAIRGLGLWTLDLTTGAHARLLEDDRLRWPTALTWFDGALWVGTVQNGLWRVDDPAGAATLSQPARRFRSRRVSSLATRPSGELLVGRDLGGLWRVATDGRSTRLLKGSVQGLVIRGGQVIVDRGARRCVLTGRRRCRSLGSPVARAPGRPGLPSDHFTTLLVHPGPDGAPRLWAGTFDQGVVVRDAAGRWQRAESTGTAPRFVNMLAAQGEALWVASATGAFRLQGGVWTRFGEDSGLPSDHVNAVHVDRSGALWFATSRGLARWDDEGLRAWSARDGLPYRIVYSVATRGEQVLAGTAHGLGIFDGSRWSVHRMGPGGLSDNWVNAVAFRADGTPVVGTYDAGVDAIGARGPRPVPGLERLWVNPGGLFEVEALGGILVATLGDGLWLWPTDGEVRRWAESDALPSNDVTSVAVFDGAVWVATRGGIARLSIPALPPKPT